VYHGVEPGTARPRIRDGTRSWESSAQPVDPASPRRPHGVAAIQPSLARWARVSKREPQVRHEQPERGGTGQRMERANGSHSPCVPRGRRRQNAVPAQRRTRTPAWRVSRARRTASRGDLHADRRAPRQREQAAASQTKSARSSRENSADGAAAGSTRRTRGRATPGDAQDRGMTRGQHSLAIREGPVAAGFDVGGASRPDERTASHLVSVRAARPRRASRPRRRGAGQSASERVRIPSRIAATRPGARSRRARRGRDP
jgi:hypothetical protein